MSQLIPKLGLLARSWRDQRILEANRPPVLRYGVAFSAVALALLFTLLLGMFITPAPFTLFLAAVMLSAWYGGLGAGLLAIALAALANLYFLLPATTSLLLGVDEALRLGVFVLVALLISSLSAARLRAEQELEIRARQQAVVAQLGQQALANADLTKLMNAAVARVAQMLEVEYCRVLELLPGERKLLLRAGVGWREGLVGQTVVDIKADSHADYTLHSNSPVVIENLPAEKRFSAAPFLQKHGVISGASVVISRPDHPFGVLGAHTTKRRAFTQDDIHFLQAVANVLAEGIERKQVEEALRRANDELEQRVNERTAELSKANEELQTEIAERKRAGREITQRNRQLAALNAITAAVSSSLKLSEVLTTLEKLLEVQLGIAGGGIFLYDEANEDALYLHAAWGLPEVVLNQFKAFSVTSIHQSHAAAEKEGVLRLNFCDVARFLNLDSAPDLPQWQTCLSIPLWAKGQIQGFAVLFSQESALFNDDHLTIFKALGQQVGVAIQNARLFEQARTSHERLQTLSHRLVEVQETERRHIARELHDQIGQVLTGLKFVLEVGYRQPTADVLASLEKAQTLAAELLARVRNLSLDLRPAMLDDLGLLPALDWLFERYTAQTNVLVTFKHNGLEDQRFAPEVETAAYRIVQEALTNVARHAQIGETMVHVWADEEMLRVQIEDQGLGFDPRAALEANQSSGLAGMRERAILLGGQFEVESQPGEGTRLAAEFPLISSIKKRELEYDYNHYSIGR